MKPEPEQFTITVRAAAGWGDWPAIARLRRALKLLLRSCGLRCVSVEATHNHHGIAEPLALPQDTPND